MSKVKIQGNASGTGIFTVAAPATNTDRTITLPDVDATVLTTAGGTISGVTQISHPTETGYASNLAETVSKATLKIKTHYSDSTLTTFGGISGGDAYIQRSNGPGSTSYNIQLNPFGGAVLTPNQPAFQIYDSVGANFSSFTKNTNLTNVQFNIGGHWSTANTRFTAPVNGTYYFYASCNMAGSNPRQYAILKNGSITLRMYSDLTGSWSPLHCGGMIYCNANDYIEFSYQGDADGGLSWHYAGGYLIG